jgi:hypothetical protein
MAETQYITSVGLAVRPSSLSACASLESCAPAMDLGGHLPWDKGTSCCSGFVMVMLKWYILSEFVVSVFIN